MDCICTEIMVFQNTSRDLDRSYLTRYQYDDDVYQQFSCCNDCTCGNGSDIRTWCTIDLWPVFYCIYISLTHGISLECTLEYEYLTRIPTLEHRYSAESNMGYKLHRALALDECDVRPVSGAPNQFTLLSTKKSFDIICSNSNMRDRWFKALKRCIEESRENSHMERVTKYAAPWNPDEMTMHCMLCKSKFTKVFNRKHHCRSC